MKTKIVYVLTAEAANHYTAQAFLSVYSLRMHNPDCHVCMVTDTSTAGNIEDFDTTFGSLIDETVSVDIPSDFTTYQKSRYLKTSLRNIVCGDFLYIDCDTLVLGDLSETDNLGCDMGACLQQSSDSWGRDNIHPQLRMYNNVRKMVADENFGINNFFNGGVILAKDNDKTREFFRTWHRLWSESALTYGFNYDQCDFWRTNAMHGDMVCELDGRYNCQVISPNIALRYLSDCKIFHYFSSSDKLGWLWIKNRVFLSELMKNIATKESLDPLINDILKDYLNGLAIVEKSRFNDYDKALVAVAVKISKKFPIINNILDTLYKIRTKRG